MHRSQEPKRQQHGLWRSFAIVRMQRHRKDKRALVVAHSDARRFQLFFHI